MQNENNDVAIQFIRHDLGYGVFVFKPIGVLEGTHDKELETFQTNYGELLDEMKTIPLLLLDDIGAENVSNWSRDEILGPILQYRMENYLPTFFTSNLTIDELETNLSLVKNNVDKVKARRIIERIKQLTEDIELVSVNRRK